MIRPETYWRTEFSRTGEISADLYLNHRNLERAVQTQHWSAALVGFWGVVAGVSAFPKAAWVAGIGR